MLSCTVFDVEHGQCSLIDIDGAKILIDCGHNSTTGWTPTNHLLSHGIDYLDFLIITNADEDHASDLHNVREHINIGALYHNRSLGADDILTLKNQGMGNGIESYVEMKRRYTGGGVAPLLDPNESRIVRTYSNNYPTDFRDENNLSVVAFVVYGNMKFCFPGDMEKAGWMKLLEQAAFRRELQDVSILLASHHGRENGCCEEVFTTTGMSPDITIISDAGKQHSTQETVDWYASRTCGLPIDGRMRRVLTTRTDGSVRILADGIRFSVQPLGT